MPDIDLKKYEYLEISELKKISDLRERVLGLIFSDIPEDIVEYIVNPIEKVLTHNGVNLKEEDF